KWAGPAGGCGRWHARRLGARGGVLALLPAGGRLPARPAAGGVHPGRPGRVGRLAARAGGPRHPPARACVPAVLHLGGGPDIGIRPVRVLLAVPASPPRPPPPPPP